MNIRYKCILLPFTICIWLIALGLDASAKDRTYRGKVLDFDTKEPLEGAIVVAYWDEAWYTVAGENTKPKDLKECLTDRNGEWSIVGPEGQEDDPHPYLAFFLGRSYIRKPEFIVFKPGYCSWPKGFYFDVCKKTLKPSGNGKIREGENVELPTLTKREDRLRAIPSPVGGENFPEKQKEFIRLLNEESRNLGIPAYD
jgi:hypothetical protein